MRKLEQLKRHLKPGRAYRRADLANWSTSVDRHIKQRVESGVLKKLSGGLYAYPKETVFGPAPRPHSPRGPSAGDKLSVDQRPGPVFGMEGEFGHVCNLCGT